MRSASMCYDFARYSSHPIGIGIGILERPLTTQPYRLQTHAKQYVSSRLIDDCELALRFANSNPPTANLISAYPQRHLDAGAESQVELANPIIAFKVDGEVNGQN